ncbi:recombinase RAD52 PWA37_004016 [Arxiozyma heterogenica]|uniref:recombinase RAD52 n=1 Tax=Arxiozyma heterogenica TaxID=278026 RepID=UPI002F07A2A8
MNIKEEKKTDFSNSSFNDIQAKLDKKLGPEYISKRIGFGSNRVAYIEGWRAINLANQIFGYNGWSTEVKQVIIDFLDERQGKFCIGCTAIVRVTLANGTFREDIGYGTVENERRKAAAFERAKKSAVTDALKRSLRSFGNALGNCLYDKDFLAKIDKVKFDPPDFDENNLFRPSDEISEVSRSGTIDMDNTCANINNSSNSSTNTATATSVATTSNQYIPNKRRQLLKVGEPSTNTTINDNKSAATSVSSNITSNPFDENAQNRYNRTTKNTITKQEQEDLLDDSLMFSDDFQDEDFAITSNQNHLIANTNSETNEGKENLNTDLNYPVTFVTGKGAVSLQNKQISNETVFNPKYQAQSIKHILDQTTSKHVPANILKEKPTSKEKIYNQYAPKGKGIGQREDSSDQYNKNESSDKISINSTDNDTNNKPITTDSFKEPKKTPQQTVIASNKKFAPPSSVVHPNSYLAVQNNQQITPGRREVGRPKVNPLQLRKPNP